MRPRFLSQNIEAKEPVLGREGEEGKWGGGRREGERRCEPEKKIPSTQAKAMSRSAKVEESSSIQRRAQSAFFLMQGTVAVKERERLQLQSRSREAKAELTRLDGSEEVIALDGIAYVGIDEQRVDLGVHSLAVVVREGTKSARRPK